MAKFRVIQPHFHTYRYLCRPKKETMKKTVALLGFMFLMMPMLGAQDIPAGYRRDILGEDFICKTIDMADDYEGKVVATLVRTKEQPATGTALLYVHGYNDYFFQAEMARFFNNNGYRFYAVDLRKYGRSKLPNQYPFMVRDLNEYFADIDSAVAQMKREGCTQIALMAHSTGGLITSLYCQKHKDNLPFYAIVLNSPFLDMNLGHIVEKVGVPVVARMGKKSPNKKLNGGMSTAYAESLLSNHHGEWQFDTAWKHVIAPPLTASWIRAIHLGQKELQKGLDIPCPILVMHSHRSVYGKKWKAEYQSGDGVLDVKDIEKYGRNLGPKAQTLTIENGLHDLALSAKPVREKFYAEALSFLNREK